LSREEKGDKMSKIKSLQDFNDACSERDLDDIQITKVFFKSSIFYWSLVSAMELTDHLMNIVVL
jgi:hypothetical protein